MANSNNCVVLEYHLKLVGKQIVLFVCSVLQFAKKCMCIQLQHFMCVRRFGHATVRYRLSLLGSCPHFDHLLFSRDSGHDPGRHLTEWPGCTLPQSSLGRFRPPHLQDLTQSFGKWH